jgi:hypothetical protein
VTTRCKCQAAKEIVHASFVSWTLLAAAAVNHCAKERNLQALCLPVCLSLSRLSGMGGRGASVEGARHGMRYAHAGHARARARAEL